MWAVYSRIKETPEPALEAITSLQSFPNIGIPEKTHTQITERTKKGIEQMRKRDYEL